MAGATRRRQTRRVVFRIYGPGPKIVDQTWKMPSLEKTK